MFYHWATLPDSRASGPTSREWNFLGWGWGLGSIALLSSSSSHAAKGEQVLGVRVKPSIASSECLKSAKPHRSWPQQTHARRDWLLSGDSAVVSMGTSTRAEAAWVSPEQLALEPGLHGHLSSEGRASAAGHAQWGAIAAILRQWLSVGAACGSQVSHVDELKKSSVWATPQCLGYSEVTSDCHSCQVLSEKK